jgi:hypothetical protein
VSDQFDHLDDSEREWLRASRRSAARRSWLLIGVLVVAAVILAWLTVDGGPGPKRAAAPTSTSADQRAIADGQQALADWGEFAVTNDLGQVKDSFWANGPQYKQLAQEAKARKKPIGPPPYTVTMSGVQVLKPRPDQRILRGRAAPDLQLGRPDAGRPGRRGPVAAVDGPEHGRDLRLSRAAGG